MSNNLFGHLWKTTIVRYCGLTFVSPSVTYHHLDKLFIVDLTITVNISLTDHFINLFVGQFLACRKVEKGSVKERKAESLYNLANDDKVSAVHTKGGHNVAQFGRGDEAVAILVKDLEGFLDLFLRVGVLHFSVITVQR
jgi:hypothetical protein